MRASTLLIPATLFAMTILASIAAHAQMPIDWQRVTGIPTAAELLDAIGTNLRGDFESAIDESAALLQKRPYDVLMHIDHCTLIDEFAYQFEYEFGLSDPRWIDKLWDRSAACSEALELNFAGHPEIELMQLQSLLDEELLQAGNDLLDGLNPAVWTEGQRSRLHTLLAQAADRLGYSNAPWYASEALNMDSAADVRLILGADLIARDEKEQATELLTSPMDGHDTQDGWYLLSKMEMLASLGEDDWIVERYADFEDIEYYDTTHLAWILTEIGALDLARIEINKAVEENAGFDTNVQRYQFEFEYRNGTAKEALDAYSSWRDAGWSVDPLGVNRFALFKRDPGLPVRARDLLGVLGVSLTLIAICLAALIPIALVHYRGLVLRARPGHVPPPEGWQLKHAWFAMSLFGAGSVLSLYFAGPLDIFGESGQLLSLNDQSSGLANVGLADTFLSLLLLLPVAAIATRIDPRQWNVKWSFVRCVLVAAAIALAFRIPLFLTWVAAPDSFGNLFEDDLMWQMLDAIRTHYGVFASLWVMSIVAPTVEEFIFRRVMLDSFTRHIGFGWANVLQAALFASAHLSLSGLPLLFVFGLVAGWLMRRSGGLLAPMAMHALFNLIAGLYVLSG